MAASMVPRPLHPKVQVPTEQKRGARLKPIDDPSRNHTRAERGLVGGAHTLRSRGLRSLPLLALGPPQKAQEAAVNMGDSKPATPEEEARTP